MILKAMLLFSKAHEGQVRRVSGLPYFDEHSLKSALILGRYKESKHFDEIFCALLGHDALEDTGMTFIEIAQEFSPLTACLIQEVTNDEEQIKLLGKKEYHKKKLSGLSNYGLIVKLLDRLINVSDAPKIQYVYDTIEIIFYIQKSRKLTGTQNRICFDILEACFNQIQKQKE